MVTTDVDATRTAQNDAFEAFVCDIGALDLRFKDVYGVVRDFNLDANTVQSRARLARWLAAFLCRSVIDSIQRQRIDDTAASLIDRRHIVRKHEFISKDRFLAPMRCVVYGLFWVDVHYRSSAKHIAQRKSAMTVSLCQLAWYTQRYGNDASRALMAYLIHAYKTCNATQ